MSYWLNYPVDNVCIGAQLISLFYKTRLNPGKESQCELSLYRARNPYNIAKAMRIINPDGKDYFPIIEELTVAFVKKCVQGRVADDMVESVVRQAIYSPEQMRLRYNIFRIPKKSGGFRTIEAPDETLKTIQRGLLYNWWYALGGLRQCVQGFVPGRGTLTNAERHFDPSLAREQVLMKMDLRDFFPSITAVSLYDRLVRLIDGRAADTRKNWFKVPPLLVTSIRESSKYKWLLKDRRIPDNGILHPLRNKVDEVEAAMILVAWGVISICTMDGRLPQGSPCSPAATNIFMDQFHTSILSALASINLSEGANVRNHVTYSIFADDTAFTSGSLPNILKSKGIASRIISKYPDITQNVLKTGIFRCGQPQRVTGISITDRISISRQTRDKLRAELYNVSVGKKKLDDKDIMRIKGLRAHIIGIDPEGWNRRCDRLYKEVIG